MAAGRDAAARLPQVGEQGPGSMAAVEYSDLGELLGLPHLDADMLATEKSLVEAVMSESTLLAAPARRIVSGGGKRLRPVLVLASAWAAAGGKLPVSALDAGVSVELVHIGSLVHDDILDDAPERRGVPTVNAEEGWEHAILVGDYILGRAGQIAAAISREVAAAIADAIVAISIGQSLETEWVHDVDRPIDIALASIGGKTADLTRMACKVGALCGGMGAGQADVVGEFGHAFGMAFQLMDDVLDIVSTEELLGKPVGNDIRCGVYTLPVMLTRDNGGGPDFRRLMAAAATDDAAAEEALARVRRSGAVDETVARAGTYAATAAGILEGEFGEGSRFAGLAALATWYIDWALERLVPA